MKANRFIEKRQAGEVPVGHMIIEFTGRSTAQIADNAGLDFVVIDTEHTGLSAAQVADLITWFKATTVAPFVRIPQIQYHFVARTLDFGALGLMVPNVKTGAEAKAIVNAAKYAPAGQRGIMLGNTNTDFKGVNPPEFLDYANRNTTIICQIESVEGIENLEAIATTQGVDVLWVGHFDLTQSMGIPGQFHDPRFLDSLKKVVDVAAAHGLGAGIQPANLEQAQEWMEIGYNVISYSGDFSVYATALTQAVQGVQNLAQKIHN
jgi:2-keto-3-deoxy-L-rhamnonate aldolase RhmA